MPTINIKRNWDNPTNPLYRYQATYEEATMRHDTPEPQDPDTPEEPEPTTEDDE